jgi:hypothetical protein
MITLITRHKRHKIEHDNVMFGQISCVLQILSIHCKKKTDNLCINLNTELVFSEIKHRKAKFQHKSCV